MNPITAESGKLYAQRAGWSVLNTGSFPMTHDRIGIGIIVKVPYTATNQQHRLSLRFEDEDANALPLGKRTERDGEVVDIMDFDAGFNIGRPANLPPGADQSIPFAMNLNNLSFETPGRYQFIVAVDGSEVAKLAFTVVGQASMGPATPSPSGRTGCLYRGFGDPMFGTSRTRMCRYA